MEARVLFGLLAVFSIVSGGLKSRARVRHLVGGSGLGLLELLAGVGLLMAQGPDMASEGAGASLAWVTVVVMAISNAYAIRRARAVRRGRRASEEHRLYMQVKLAQAMEGKSLDEEPGEEL